MMAKQTQSILKQTLVDEAVKLLAWTKVNTVYPKNSPPLLMRAAVHEAESKIRRLFELAIEIDELEEEIESGLQQLTKAIGKNWNAHSEALLTQSIAGPKVGITVEPLAIESDLFEALLASLCQIAGRPTEPIDLTPANETWQYVALKLVDPLRRLMLCKDAVHLLDDVHSESSLLIEEIEQTRAEFEHLSTPDNKFYRQINDLTIYLKRALRYRKNKYSPGDLADTWEGFVRGDWPNLTNKRPWCDDATGYITATDAHALAVNTLGPKIWEPGPFTRLIKSICTIKYMTKGRRTKINEEELTRWLLNEVPLLLGSNANTIDS